MKDFGDRLFCLLTSKMKRMQNLKNSILIFNK